MKTTSILWLCVSLLIFSSCYKDDNGIYPIEQTLEKTSWEMQYRDLGEGNEPFPYDVEKRYFYFTDKTNGKIVSKYDGDEYTTTFTYTFRNDTLITYQEDQMEYFYKVEVLTNKKLVMNTFKSIDHYIHEDTPVEGRLAYTFKKIE